MTMSSMPVPCDAATESAVRRTGTGRQSIWSQCADRPGALSSRESMIELATAGALLYSAKPDAPRGHER